MRRKMVLISLDSFNIWSTVCPGLQNYLECHLTSLMFSLYWKIISVTLSSPTTLLPVSGAGMFWRTKCATPSSSSGLGVALTRPVGALMSSAGFNNFLIVIKMFFQQSSFRRRAKVKCFSSCFPNDTRHSLKTQWPHLARTKSPFSVYRSWQLFCPGTCQPFSLKLNIC